MKQPPKQTHILFQNIEDSGIGRITVAAHIQNNTTYQAPRRLDCYALVLVLSGEGSFCDERGNTSTLRDQDALLLFPGVEHQYGPPAGTSWDEIYLLFEGSIFDYWRDHRLISPDRPIFKLSKTQLEKIWEGDSPPLEQVCKLLSLLAISCTDEDLKGPTPKKRQWLDNARALLTQHALESDAARMAARKMGMSYQVFRKTFRKEDGRSPGDFRTHVVMEEAARRLLTEMTPIKTIADELNYCDEFHFTRRFREHHGTPPAAYRRRMVPGH